MAHPHLESFIHLLKPPGQGLLSFSSSVPFPSSKIPQKTWYKHIQKAISLALKKDQPLWLGVPSDSGGGICRGTAHGPAGIRASLKESPSYSPSFDLGDIPCVPQLSHDIILNPLQIEKSGKAIWAHQWKKGYPASPLSLLNSFLTQLWTSHPQIRIQLLGGDHSIAGPVFSALNSTRGTQNLGVLQIDAHTDLLEERFGIQHCFGTWTTHALKTFSNPKCWVQLGIRATSKSKRYWERQYGLKQYWCKDIQKSSVEEFTKELIFHFHQQQCTELYISNDIDGTDKKFAFSTGTAEDKGLQRPWLKNVLKKLSKEFRIIGSDLSEVAPVLGNSMQIAQTLRTARTYLEALYL